MLIFERVRYQNFLAVGQVPMDIRLNAHDTTLIVGRNGAGKSTLTEAVCFALFGRSLRNVNKPALINSVNKRETVVELWMRVGERAYHIKRGIKPNVFEIHQNGELLPQPASLSDYQSMLEDDIIGMNYKSFMQIVVLGSATYVPFMRLTPAARREIVEDLLDIEIFSTMATLTKDELGTLKSKIEQLAQQRTLLEEQKRIADTYTLQKQENLDAQLAAIDANAEETRRTLAQAEARMAELLSLLAAYDTERDTLTAAQEKLREYGTMLKTIEARHKKFLKEREFYESHDECPTCAQTITPTFKTEQYDALSQKEVATIKAEETCRKLIGKYEATTTTLYTSLATANGLSTELQTLKAQTPLHERRLRELAAERTRLHTPTETRAVDVAEIVSRIEAATEEHASASRRRAILDTANTLLKDSGIKSRIIKHYLPIINKQINTYLTAMDFPIHFTLDDEFVEHMQSRHREDFAYESFSEGEKKRIDLALLLTWRAVARIKNSASCNLLVMDEVFDSSLDVAGVDEFMKILQALEKTNIFVISHKTDQLIDKFHHVLHFEKQRGFSCVKK